MPIGEWNKFRSYIYKTGLGVKKTEQKLGKKITHLLLDGGNISVPPDKEDDFLICYARELFAGTDLYVVELKTEPCFFFMSEFDIKFKDRSITEEELLEFVRVVQGVISKAFSNGDARLEVAVSTAPPKNSHDLKGQDCIQSGVHLNWRIPVDLDTAWILRAWIIRELDQKLSSGQLGMCDSWLEAYDPCVLGKNGLRLIGSRKAENCPACKGGSYKRGEKTTAVGPCISTKNGSDHTAWGNVCSTCQNVGRVDRGRPYKLVMIVDGNGDPIPEALEYYHRPENIIEFVKYLSIRCPPGIDKTTPIKFESTEQERRMKEAARIDRRQKKPGIAATNTTAQSSTDAAQKRLEKRDELIEFSPEDPVYQSISKYILGEFRGMPIVSRIKKTRGGDCYIINTKCHFCENKEGDHGHSTIYFVLKPNGCVQRCFCQKNYNGKVCSTFVGKQRAVPQDLLHMCFSATLLSSKRKEEKRAQIAATLMNTGRAAEDHRNTNHPYGEAPGISLPQLTGRAAQGIRRRGISPKKDYSQIRSEVVPPYTMTRFITDLKNAHFKIV